MDKIFGTNRKQYTLLGSNRKLVKKCILKRKTKPEILFEDEIVYTEDQVRVFNLYLGNIPHSITEKDLHDHFSRYGDLKSVEIYSTKPMKKQVYKYGFVNFKEARSAAAALKILRHLICRRRIQVRPADSWKQPIPEQKKDRETSTSGENDPSKTPILNLNDDCLLHVCSFLTLRQQLSLSETCKRFSEFLENILHHKKTLIICKERSGEATLMQLKQILLKVGKDIQQVKCLGGIVHEMRTLKLISQTCPKLQILRMENCTFPNPIVFREVGLKLQYLTKVELPACNINDDIFQHLVVLQKVEYLDLSCNVKITGQFFDKFPKLVYLDLNGCSGVKPCFFNNICENGLLQTLHINRCSDRYDCLSVDAILKLKHLEELSFCDFFTEKGITKISEIESLKSLTINYNLFGLLHVDFFKVLAKNKSEKLESLTVISSDLNDEKMEYICKLKMLRKLSIVSLNNIPDSFIQKISALKKLMYLGLPHCKHIRPQALIELFEQSTEIKKLDITGCPGITNEIIFEIAETIKERGTKSPCTIYAGSTEVSKNILEKIISMEYASFVAVSFNRISGIIL